MPCLSSVVTRPRRTWNRNQDAIATPSDQVYIVRNTTLCPNKAQGGANATFVAAAPSLTPRTGAGCSGGSDLAAAVPWHAPYACPPAPLAFRASLVVQESCSSLRCVHARAKSQVNELLQSSKLVHVLQFLHTR